MLKKILIIEDDKDLSDSLTDILQVDDYIVLAKNSGREGLACALIERPDLIILDIRMPDMDGYTVFQKLREDEWGKTAKVMILTASESTENISKNIPIASEYIFFKPEVSVDQLRSTIAERLAN